MHYPDDKIYTIEELSNFIHNHNCECLIKSGVLSRFGKTEKCDLIGPFFYLHDGGAQVEGFLGKHWIYYICQNCKYQWALWKVINTLKYK